MSRLLLCLSLLAGALVLSASAPALAQPGGYAPAPAPLDLRLSDDDLMILERGRISTGQYVTGGVIGSYFGFGVGHMIQQRWMETGWLFTVGESAAITAMVVGAVGCANGSFQEEDRLHNGRSSSSDACSVELIIGGLLGYAGLRTWEIIDLWVAPPRHNRRYDKLTRRSSQRRYSFSLAPTGKGSGVASLSLSF